MFCVLDTGLFQLVQGSGIKQPIFRTQELTAAAPGQLQGEGGVLEGAVAVPHQPVQACHGASVGDNCSDGDQSNGSEAIPKVSHHPRGCPRENPQRRDRALCRHGENPDHQGGDGQPTGHQQ
jgi:hypothetical protein